MGVGPEGSGSTRLDSTRDQGRGIFGQTLRVPVHGSTKEESKSRVGVGVRPTDSPFTPGSLAPPNGFQFITHLLRSQKGKVDGRDRSLYVT